MTNLTIGNTYQITCIAENSRPSVTLGLYADYINLLSLGDSTISNLITNSQCDSNQLCTTGLILNLTLNDVRLQTIKTLSCQALNTTFPYNLNASLSLNLNVFAPAGKIMSVEII